MPRGIESLPSGEAVRVRETGVLSDLAAGINRASDMLQSQARQLRRRETARANWIAGVSHDIRMPLSMVIGYADRLENDAGLTGEARRTAAAIVRQGGRIRDLVNDLNLASKLEYNMQPVHMARCNVVSIVRQVVADFINMDMDGRHPLEWETDEAVGACLARVDADLIRRAVSNLIQNSINHNEGGCHIYAGVLAGEGECVIRVEDDGAGVDEGQLRQLKDAPHYMVCDEDIWGQRHGLGLLIVKQVMAVHGGEVRIGHSAYGGFLAELVLPSGA